MNRKEQHGEDITALEDLIDEITVDAYGEDEQLSALIPTLPQVRRLCAVNACTRPQTRTWT